MKKENLTTKEQAFELILKIEKELSEQPIYRGTIKKLGEVKYFSYIKV